MMFGTISTLIRSVWSSIFLWLLLIAGCNQPSGPCDWHIQRVEAKVIAIEPYQQNAAGDSLYHVVVEFDGSIYAEKKHDLGDLRDFEFTKASLKTNNIRLGNIYKATVSEVKTGNCKSPVLSFDSKLKP